MTFKNILKEFSLDEAWKHVEWINENAPVRLPGTDGQQIAAEYFVQKLASYGFEARLDSFSAFRSVPQRGSIHLMSPEVRDYACEPCGHIVSTSDDGLEVDVIYVNGGSKKDYEGKDVAGTAVLVEISGGPSRDEKVRVATSLGASAIIYVCVDTPESDAIPHMDIRSVWGNPTRSSMSDVPQISAVSISRAAGDEFIAMLSRGSVRARLVAQAENNWGPLPQPIGRLKVPHNSTADFLVLGSHYDAWEPGMTANAAGNALTLELARVFARHRESLRRDIFIGFWNGHAIGGHSGSTWFADRYWDHLDEHAVAYFNVESVGLAQTTIYAASSTPELAKWHQHVEQRVFGGPTRHGHLGRQGEQSFFGMGLPALEGQFQFTDETARAWGGAKNGWWQHTKYDTLDKIDRDRFAQTGHLYVHYIWDMCSLPILPMDFTNNATRIDKAASTMQKRAKERFELDLPTSSFVKATNGLLAATKSLREDSQIQALNRTLMKLSRLLTPAFATVGGRYAQDRHSHNGLAEPIPAVHAMEQLATAAPGGELSHLLYTELLRERNKLSDALRHATTEIDRLLNH